MKPAIAGGTPQRKDFLVFGRPRITQAEIDEVMNTIHSGWLGTGPKTHKFEELFKVYTHAKFAVALNSCTAGLHLALDILGIKDGDEVITSPLTFTSAANVIVHHHAKPIFADIDPSTWNIDPSEIEKRITKKTKAIIPVHLHGRPCDMDAIKKIAKKYKLFVIEDAAHAAESWYKGKKIGTISDLTAFSFYVTKNIMTGEGGMLTTNKKKWADEARVRSLHGISKDAWKRYSSSGYKPYETLYPGYKYNMMDLVASFGIHQIKDVEDNLKVRSAYWDLYHEALKDMKELILPAPFEKDTVHARHIFGILIRPELLTISRNQFLDAMSAENIGVGVHFTALHLHRFFKNTYGYKKKDFPHSEYVGDRIVSLPLSASMSPHDVHDVIQAVSKIIHYYRKK